MIPFATALTKGGKITLKAHAIYDPNHCLIEVLAGTALFGIDGRVLEFNHQAPVVLNIRSMTFAVIRDVGELPPLRRK